MRLKLMPTSPHIIIGFLPLRSDILPQLYMHRKELREKTLSRAPLYFPTADFGKSGSRSSTIEFTNGNRTVNEMGSTIRQASRTVS